jgi:hypothetical protein
MDSELYAEKGKTKMVSNLKTKAQFMQDMSIPFKLIKSGSTFTLQSDLFSETARKKDKLFTPQDLAFVNKVKNYIENSDINDLFYKNLYTESAIDYIQVSPKLKEGDVYENVYCIDLTAAYWRTAYLLGIINKNIYQLGENMSKPVRLASLGSLAKRKTIWDFDGKSYSRERVILSPHSNLWFAICKRVSDIMTKATIALGEDFYFYWVDGIYFRNTEANKDKVLKIFREFDYQSKPESIEWIKVEKKHFSVKKLDKEKDTVFSWEVGMTKTSKHEPLTKWIEEQELLELARTIVYGKKPSKK